eukprot:533772-Pelagomonas_calceolata.AAC.4
MSWSLTYGLYISCPSVMVHTPCAGIPVCDRGAAQTRGRAGRQRSAGGGLPGHHHLRAQAPQPVPRQDAPAGIRDEPRGATGSCSLHPMGSTPTLLCTIIIIIIIIKSDR